MNLHVFWVIIKLLFAVACGIYAVGVGCGTAFQFIAPHMCNRKMSDKTKCLLLLSVFFAITVFIAICYSF